MTYIYGGLISLGINLVIFGGFVLAVRAYARKHLRGFMSGLGAQALSSIIVPANTTTAATGGRVVENPGEPGENA